jgi:putative oxygen-independent coproporphyrinogen III oxidase
VHIPFCARRCDYCAFATWTDRHHLMPEYASACRTELGRAVSMGMPNATSVFFGGGTPSLLPAELLTAILDGVPRERDAEVTVECNPDTVTEALLGGYRAAGVTRISLGVQSMNPRVLAALGRVHDTDAVARSARLIRETGFETFNVDLIYGSVGETDADWRATLDAVLALSPPHVSAYALTVEAGTPLAADVSRHPDEDTQAARYELADEVLAGAGLRNYEISNWALPGHECRHNELYWSQGNYRGIGCAAHSHESGRRWWNIRTPERYIACVAEGRSPVAEEERLTVDQQQAEAVHLALRTSGGVETGALTAGAQREAMALSELGLVTHQGTRVVLTRRGRLLASEVALRLA